MDRLDNDTLRAILNVSVNEGDLRDPFELTEVARGLRNNAEFTIIGKN